MDASLRKAFGRLAEDIFACFLRADYENNLYLYEHRIHDSKSRCIALIHKRAKREDVSCALTLYNGLVDCGLLRWRIKDKSAFEVCRAEMAAINNSLVAILSSRAASGAGPSAFNMQVDALEALYQSVLQVTAKEPLPFLLFIYSLKALKENCLAIHCTASA